MRKLTKASSLEFSFPGTIPMLRFWNDHRRIFAKGDFYFILLIFMNVLLLLKVLNDFNKSNFRINHVL